MKLQKKLFLLFFLSLFFNNSGNAQFWKKLKKKAEDAVIKKADKKMNDVLNKKKKKSNSPEKEEEKKEKQSSDKKNEKSEKTETTPTQNKPAELYRNFKFIPGEKVIFYDDLQFEEVGEFPSKWDLLLGGTEIAILNGTKVVIPTTEESYGNVITPLFNSTNYLGDEFTIEFDIYLDNLIHDYDEQKFGIFFDSNNDDFKNTRSIHGGYSNADIQFKIDKDELKGKIYKNLEKTYDYFPLEKIEKTNIAINNWNHVSISYYKKKIKVYFNNKRIANLPNYSKPINGVSIKLFKPLDYNDKNVSLGKNSLKVALKNIRIAHGGGQMYKRIISNGKYVTNGILFDSGKATIKSQSMGIINKIVTVMNEKADWNFEIIGHTDSDGDAAANLILSKARAEAVKNAIVKQGIKAERLSTIGKGESEPLNSNSSAIEKANNRRVAFVKK